MKSRLLFLPFAAFVALSGYLGWQMGQPMSETEIINRYAQIYVSNAGDGALVSDCYATPNTRPEVRLVVRCTHADGTQFTYFADQRGRRLPADNPQEPQA